MRILTFTSLYPNAVTPSHGVFVENRLVHLVSGGRVAAVVVAPVPWFPWRHPRFGRYAGFARVPSEETRHGVRVHHPRYLTLPGLGALLAPLSIALGARATVARLMTEGRVDAIDAHYFFPDGVAAALLARWFKLPLVITARGSDINLVAGHPVAKRAILWAAGVAGGLITVSRALRDRLVELGADAKRTVVLRNGVDAERFRPSEREAARSRFGIRDNATRVVVSVGRLHPGKGHDLAIAALASLPEVRLLIAGSGAERERLDDHAAALGLADRVDFLGQMAHDDLPDLYSAADVLVLASASEGWPNVLLEAMACGTPVVATDVGGTREIVTAPEAGTIIGERTVVALAEALRRLFETPLDRDATRRFAQRFSWSETSAGQEQLFAKLRCSPSSRNHDSTR